MKWSVVLYVSVQMTFRGMVRKSWEPDIQWDLTSNKFKVKVVSSEIKVHSVENIEPPQSELMDKCFKINMLNYLWL